MRALFLNFQNNQRLIIVWLDATNVGRHGFCYHIPYLIDTEPVRIAERGFETLDTRHLRCDAKPLAAKPN